MALCDYVEPLEQQDIRYIRPHLSVYLLVLRWQTQQHTNHDPQRREIAWRASGSRFLENGTGPVDRTNCSWSDIKSRVRSGRDPGGAGTGIEEV